ncbi:lanthionine synthetase LanC family protein [Streptomyces sp. NPDC044780]|uniref:lanthionine synthetase LanC family protein n=1 Tax=unclassified Streptomyces TaxID=2593676 RepID=UPI003404E906
MLDLGLPHGVAGPFALLSLCWTRGLRVPDHDTAIRRIARWLMSWRQEHPDTGPGWPGTVSADQELAPARPVLEPQRASWCYGTPGIARALHLAGVALGEDAWVHTAAEAIRAVFARPDGLRGIDDPGLCHGLAGLARITGRMAGGATSPDRAGAPCRASQADASQPYRRRRASQPYRRRRASRPYRRRHVPRPCRASQADISQPRRRRHASQPCRRRRVPRPWPEAPCRASQADVWPYRRRRASRRWPEAPCRASQADISQPYRKRHASRPWPGRRAGRRGAGTLRPPGRRRSATRHPGPRGPGRGGRRG